MKTYESAMLVELGCASDLVLGEDGVDLDSPVVNAQQLGASFVDVDE